MKPPHDPRPKVRELQFAFLSPPPSVNSAFRNVAGKGRVKTKAYRNWIKGELSNMVVIRAQPVETPVEVVVGLAASVRGDPDNYLKAPLDLLVRAGVIPDDGKKYVREATARQISGTQCTISVRTA